MRPDDEVETIKKRLLSYHKETAQLVGFYQKRAASGENAPRYTKLNGLDNIDSVKAQLIEVLGQ